MNSTCTADEVIPCDLPRGDEEGLFVCRTRTNPVTNQTNTVPICIPTDRSIAGDECGCCDEDCPEPCDTCGCELPFPDRDGVTRQGVEVLVAGMDEPMCVPAFASMMMVARSEGRVTCNAECD